MVEYPILHTERLILRPPRLEELDDWIAMMADEEVARHIGGVQAPLMVWRSLMAMIGAWTATGVAMFSIYERESGRWLGRVGPWCPYGWPGTEIGWNLVRSAWGRGFASEAAAATLDHAFDTLGWVDVIHMIAPDNPRSQHVAQRLGSVRRGPGRLPAPHDDADVEIWGQTREQWKARSGR